MAEFTTYKRWTLRPGRRESELVELVREQIVPHYKKLHGCIRLGLLRIKGTRSYLAMQCWESQESWRATTASDYYRRWFEEYRPILARWDEIMDLEEEWNTEDMLGKGSS